jgi:hypothetical protein
VKSLKTYKTPAYTVIDRNVNLNFSYQKELYNFDKSLFVDGEYNEHTSEYDGNLQGALSGNYKKAILKKSSWSDLNVSLSADGGLNDNDDEYMNDLTGVYSSVSYRSLNADLKLKSHFTYERHFCFLSNRDKPFFSITGDNLLTFSSNRNISLKNANRQSSFSKERQDIASHYFNLKPEIGISMRQPVAPVYRSFGIERKLKEANVIRDTLFLRTINTLAAFVASHEKYSLTHEKYYKYLMKDLDVILRSDSMVDTSQLNAYTYFKLQEALRSNSPDFFCGFRIALGCNFNARGNYTMREGYKNHYEDYNGEKFDAEYNQFALPIDFTASYTFPLLSKLFFESGLKLNTSSVDEYDYKLKEQSAYFNLHFFITDRILCRAFIVDLPLEHAIPNGDKPKNIGLTMYFYIEDNVSLDLSFKKFFDIYESTHKKIRNTIFLGAHYEF